MFRDLKANEIECRVQKLTANGATLLLYKDARCDQNILDETVGAMNWKKSYKSVDGKLVCTIEIWDAEKKQWIGKEDTGTESNMEAQKGEFSDAQKRAGFAWGIGRELYTAPFIYVNAQNCNIDKGNNGKFVCYDSFAVEHIEIEDGCITAISILNNKTKKVVFGWEKKPSNKSSFEKSNKAKLIELIEKLELDSVEIGKEYGLTSSTSEARYAEVIKEINGRRCYA